MKKAITPVISIVILLLIAVSLGSLAYSFFLGYYDPLTSKTISLVDSHCYKNLARITLMNSGTSRINITSQLMQTEPYNPDSSTVLLLHSDEISGGETGDSSTYGNDGAVSGDVVLEDGKYKKGLKFDGDDDYVDVGDDSSMNFGTSTDFTIEAWIKRDTQGVTEDEGIINRYDPSGTGNPFKGWRFEIRGSDGKLIFYAGDGSVSNFQIATASQTIMDDTDWHYVAAVVDRTNGAQLYIDGKPDGTPDTTDLGVDISRAVTVQIGGMGWGADPNSFDFDGVIDEVRISDKVRDFSADEQGWNYWCEPSGNSVTCGDLTVEKTSGGAFTPGFSSPFADPQKTFTFKDSSCEGTCKYNIITPTLVLSVSAFCS